MRPVRGARRRGRGRTYPARRVSSRMNPAFPATLDDIRSWGAPAAFDAALRAAEKGFVTSASYDPAAGTASGEVVVGASTVSTSFALVRHGPAGRWGVRSRCPCPAATEAGAICFHVLAVAITLARRALAATKPEARREESAHDRLVAENVARGLSVETDEAGLPARLFVQLPRDWIPRFRLAREGKGPGVPASVLVQPAGEGAQLLPVQELVRTRRALRLEKDDENLLYVLEDIASGDLTRPPVLAPAYLLWIFDRLAALDRPLLVAESRPISVRPRAEALDSHLLVSLDHEKGEILLMAQVDAPAGCEAETDPPLLAMGKYAWALYGRRLFPLAAVVPPVYQRVYLDTIGIPRLGTRSFLLHELPGLRGQFDVRFDEGFDPDAFTWTPAKPSFALRASAADDRGPLFPLRSDTLGNHTAVELRLDAVYPAAEPGGAPTTVPANAPAKDFSFPDPADPYNYFVRNVDSERAALAILASHGLAGPGAARESSAALRGNALPPLRGADAALELLATTAPALASLPRWRFVPEGDFADVSAHLERIATIVRVRQPADAPGAFDVDYSFQTARRSRNVLPADIGAARRDGRPWIMHGPRRLLFDPAALDQFSDLLRECGASQSPLGGAFRVSAALAPFFVGRLARLSSSLVHLDPSSEPWAERVRALYAPGASSADDPATVPEPLRSTLRPYQRAGVAWLRALERGAAAGILADEMGLGKTVQTLAWIALERFNRDARGMPALVVCPTSLVENWAEESRRFTPRLRLLVCHGDEREALMREIDAQDPARPGRTTRALDPDALAAALGGADLAITSYALLRRDVAAWERCGFSIVVLDEAQNIKNRTTQNAETVKRIPAGCRLAVTGTPVENSPADLWSIWDFLMRGYLGTWDDFRARYELPISLRGAPGATAQQNREADQALSRLHDKVAPFLLRRLKTEVARDLPSKTVQTVFTDLGDDQRAVYDKFFAAARTQVADALGTAGFGASRMLVLTALLRLRQVSCHLALLGDKNPRPDSARPSAKLEWLLDFLDEAAAEGHRVLVFSQFVEMLGLVRAALDAAGTAYCYLDGSSHDRLEQVHRFNADPSIPVFLVSLKAGGTGLNLTGADEVVLFDPWWNPAIEDQAVDRAHRIGQKRHVRAIKLVSKGTIEEKVLAMQARKRAVIDATVSATDSADLASLTEGDVRSLFEL